MAAQWMGRMARLSPACEPTPPHGMPHYIGAQWTHHMNEEANAQKTPRTQGFGRDRPKLAIRRSGHQRALWDKAYLAAACWARPIYFRGLSYSGLGFCVLLIVHFIAIM